MLLTQPFSRFPLYSEFTVVIFRGRLGLGSDIGFPNVALTSGLIPSPPITETVKLQVSRGPGKADLGVARCRRAPGAEALISKGVIHSDLELDLGLRYVSSPQTAASRFKYIVQGEVRDEEYSTF